jgi:hypothetical protein
MMAKFRKKPIIVEAMQFDGTHDSACLIDGWSVGRAQAHFVCTKMFDVDEDYCRFTGRMIVHTPHGGIFAEAGDWIIKGVMGEFYPCKPDAFSATYELVEE